jgi:nucleotide-binding universal stress UspA family protein
MYRKLLVPLDGSGFSQQALTFACDIAQRSGAGLHLAHVHTLSNIIYVAGMPVIDAELQSLAQEHERAYLEQIRERLLSTTKLSITCANLDSAGSVAVTLAGYVETQAIDLVVMTTHGRGGLERAWLGSVADALVRCSSVPLLLLRPDQHAPEMAPPRIKRILIPLDGSALSEQILSPALELGGLVQAEYTLLRAAEPFIIAGYDPLAQVSQLDLKISQERLDEAQRYLDHVAERLQAEGIATRAHVLQATYPAVAILDEARQLGADLIAMTTHGRSGLARLLLGSVADKVLRGAALPLLIQRPRS